jgi:hypothetical protein
LGWDMKKLLVAFIAFHLASCSYLSTKKVNLFGSWRLNDVAATSKKSDFDIEAGLSDVVSNGAMLNLFKDSTYSYISGRGEYKFGKWKFDEDEKRIFFLSTKGSTDVLLFSTSVNAKKIPELELTDEDAGMSLKYSKEGEPLENSADDPFHPSNNTWRLKPAAPESKEKLKERLANYFRHFALILKAAKARKQEVIYFGLSQGPIQVYNGGIGIRPLKSVPATWKNTYYDDADAATAYSFYEKVLKQKIYQGGSVGDWVEDDYKIILSLYKEIKQLETDSTSLQ